MVAQPPSKAARLNRAARKRLVASPDCPVCAHRRKMRLAQTQRYRAKLDKIG